MSELSDTILKMPSDSTIRVNGLRNHPNDTLVDLGDSDSLTISQLDGKGNTNTIFLTDEELPLLLPLLSAWLKENSQT